MRRYLNIEAMIEGICCLFFSAMIGYLAYSGKYLLFVTPRMKPYLYFASVIMLLWAGSCFIKIGKPKYRLHVKRCLVLILPLMAMVLPYGALSAGSAQAVYSNTASRKVSGDKKTAEEPNKDGTGSSPSPAETENTQKAQDADAGQDTTAGQSASQDERQTPLPSGLDEAAKIITVSDKEFYQWLKELSYYPEKYEGYTVHMHGTIYRNETMAENEFAVTRLAMSCCVADLSPCGLLCFWDGAKNLEQDTWVNVTATYHYDQQKGMKLTVNGMEDAEPAEEKYVYPFNY